MLSEKMTEALNQQINKEFYSAYLYLEMANYYADESLDGFQNWFNVQAKEEMAHAMLFVNYLLDHSCHVDLEAIAKPGQTYTDYKAPLEASLKHEKEITASINNLYELSVQDNDYRTRQILDWFIREQYEEEVNAQNLIDRYKIFGEDKHALWEMNQDLLARTFVEPTIS